MLAATSTKSPAALDQSSCVVGKVGARLLRMNESNTNKKNISDL